MERGNHGQVSLWLQRFAGEDTADRMRNCIVYVKQIQILGFRDLRHFGRERQGIRLMLEQRIRHHLDFMEAHALVKFCEPGRQRGGDKVDGVAACRQFFSQLRADDATAAIGGIDRDADVYFKPGLWSWVLGLSSLWVLTRLIGSSIPCQRSKTEDQRPGARRPKQKKRRQATLAIACLHLNLAHLICKGGK